MTEFEVATRAYVSALMGQSTTPSTGFLESRVGEVEELDRRQRGTALATLVVLVFVAAVLVVGPSVLFTFDSSLPLRWLLSVQAGGLAAVVVGILASLRSERKFLKLRGELEVTLNGHTSTAYSVILNGAKRLRAFNASGEVVALVEAQVPVAEELALELGALGDKIGAANTAGTEPAQKLIRLASEVAALEYLAGEHRRLSFERPRPTAGTASLAEAGEILGAEVEAARTALGVTDSPTIVGVVQEPDA